MYQHKYNLILQYFLSLSIDDYSTLPCLRQLLIFFLFLHMLLFCIFHINRIIKYVVFCGWLLSCHIVFSRFIYVAVSIIISFLLLSDIYPIYSHWKHIPNIWHSNFEFPKSTCILTSIRTLDMYLHCFSLKCPAKSLSFFLLLLSVYYFLI